MNRKGQAAVEMAIFGSLILIVFSVMLTYGQRLDGQMSVKMEAFRKALQKAYQRNSAVTYTLKKDVRMFNLFGGLGQGQGSTLGASASVMWQKGVGGSQGTDNQTSFAYYQVNNDLVGREEGFNTDGKGGDDETDISLPRYTKEVVDAVSRSRRNVTVPVSVYKEEVVKAEAYKADNIKVEDHGTLTNTKSSDLKERVRTTLHFQEDRSIDRIPDDGVSDPPEATDITDETSIDPETGNLRSDLADARIQGAYYNPATGRIEYDAASAGKTVHQERSWTTTQ